MGNGAMVGIEAPTTSRKRSATATPPSPHVTSPILDSTRVTKSVLDLKMRVLPAELTVHRGSNLDAWKRQRLRSKLREQQPTLPKTSSEVLSLIATAAASSVVRGKRSWRTKPERSKSPAARTVRRQGSIVVPWRQGLSGSGVRDKCGVLPASGDSSIPVVQSTDLSNGDDSSIRRRINVTRDRGVAVESGVNSRHVVVANVTREDSMEMVLAEDS